MMEKVEKLYRWPLTIANRLIKMKAIIPEEPLADSEWLKDYEETEEEYKKTEEMLNKRLTGTVPVSD
ncbi:hypothetical protein QZH41_010035 [Actinostola sp. cb2023]|nr:hypothetical protein QZH41_010035 [Actinostola sp. cb2023]